MYRRHADDAADVGRQCTGGPLLLARLNVAGRGGLTRPHGLREQALPHRPAGTNARAAELPFGDTDRLVAFNNRELRADGTN